MLHPQILSLEVVLFKGGRSVTTNSCTSAAVADIGSSAAVIRASASHMLDCDRIRTVSVNNAGSNGFIGYSGCKAVQISSFFEVGGLGKVGKNGGGRPDLSHHCVGPIEDGPRGKAADFNAKPGWR